MKNRRAILTLLAAALAITAVGWTSSRPRPATAQAADAPQTGSVGVVDYSKVMRDMGWSTKLDANAQAYRDQLGKEYAAFEARYQQQLSEIQKALAPQADKLTQQQQQQFTQTVLAARQTLVALQNQARERLASYQQEWFRRYREGLSPVVRQVAQQRGIKVVIAQTETVVFVEPAADLSNAVVDGAKAQPPTITDVPMASLQGPANVGPNMTVPTTGPTTHPATQPTTAH